MRLVLLILFFCTVTVFAAPERQVFRNASGRITGTAHVNGCTTVYRDAYGRTTGTARQHGNTITYRDSSGRNTGTKRR